MSCEFLKLGFCQALKTEKNKLGKIVATVVPKHCQIESWASESNLEVHCIGKCLVENDPNNQNCQESDNQIKRIRFY